MYILARETIPIGHQVNCVGHAALGCYLKFKEKPEMQQWLDHSYKKITCKVSDEEFEKAKQEADDWYLCVENDIEGQETVLAFCPREKYSEFFKTLRLYS